MLTPGPVLLLLVEATGAGNARPDVVCPSTDHFGGGAGLSVDLSARS